MLLLLWVCRDYGEEVSIELRMNYSAVRGLIGRPALGKLRHLETGFLWILRIVDCQVFGNQGAVRQDIKIQLVSEPKTRATRT